MGIWIKICGLTDARSVAAVAEAGADAAGFVFAPSSREIEPGAAANLAAALPPGIERIAVTKHPDKDGVARILAQFRPGIWQTDAADFDQLELPPHCRALPVWRTALDEDLPDWILFEGPRCGSGERSDWTLAAQLAARTRVVLAGGLTAANVGEAIRCVRPFGVDVSSGVESAPGVKDPAKIHAFVAAVRAAEHAL